MGSKKLNKMGGSPLKGGKMAARHILVDKLNLAKEIYEKLQNGMNFDGLARKYSTCSSKRRGGNLGSFGKGKMVKEFWDGCYALKKGEISKPVKSQFGYHIIKRMK